MKASHDRFSIRLPGSSQLGFWLLSFSLLGLSSNSGAADFNVTSPGSSYTINGQASNPTLTLVRGKTYTFAISAASLSSRVHK